MLERAYRLALELQHGPSEDGDAGGPVANELVELLDDARVALLVAAGLAMRD